jgi:hypothetical protein
MIIPQGDHDYPKYALGSNDMHTFSCRVVLGRNVEGVWEERNGMAEKTRQVKSN